MSGGHFDYQQHHIEDIANSIEKEIEEATKSKPPLVWREGVSVFKKIDNWHSVGIYKGFKTYDEAVKHLKKDKAYKFVREYEKDGKRISEFMDGDKLIEVKELRYQEYEDGEYYPEYTEETIQIFKIDNIHVGHTINLNTPQCSEAFEALVRRWNNIGHITSAITSAEDDAKAAAHLVETNF